MVQNSKNINLKTLGFRIFNNPVNSVPNALGYSVSGVGYINKDGYDDVIVGFPHKSPDVSSYLSVSYVIFGSAFVFYSVEFRKSINRRLV